MDLYKEQAFMKEIDGLTVEGKFLPAINGLQVSVYYKDENNKICLVNKEIMGRCNPAYPFCYVPKGECVPKARGLLIFGMDPLTGLLVLILSLSAPTEKAITFNMDGPPELSDENHTLTAMRN